MLGGKMKDEKPAGPVRIRGDEVTVVAPAGLAPPESAAFSVEAVSSTPARQVLGGRYELLGLLGVGGMGSVYRARDTELDEVVALKVLKRELITSPGILERFRQEAKLARRVTHKNVARTFDIGEHSGEKFLTMELIDGESLGARLTRDGALSMKDTIAIGSAICAGLAAAHAAGVVHRDLKPDNVLVAKDGRIALTDFGIARAVLESGVAPMTQGVPIGTPAYMAPEQVEGAQDVDARADLYALGAILYEMMTGERAWLGESVYSVAVARLVKPPPDPRDKRKELADAAALLVMKCMAKKREDRYATAEDVAGALATLTQSRAPAPTKQSMRPPPAVALADEAKTIAVLPFRNAGKAEDDYLADGLTDDLIDALSMTKGLRVRSRGAVMRFKGVERDARELGRELDVQVVVDGTVRKHGTGMRVSARLVSVADGFQLWAKRFDCTDADFLQVGDSASNAIAAALTVERVAKDRAAPKDPIAIDLYLRARHAYREGWEDNERSIAMFEQALARAPDDPLILSGFALAQLRRFSMDTEGPQADRAGEIGKESAERALAISPHFGEARLALAQHRLTMGDAIGAARDLREALRIAPGAAEVHDMYGRLLVEVGRPEQGIACLRTAMVLEPTLRSTVEIVRVRAMLGDFTGCEEFFSTPPESTAAQNTFWFYATRVAAWRCDHAWNVKLRDAMHAAEFFPLKPSVEPIAELLVTGKGTETLRKGLEHWGKISGRARRRPMFFRQLTAEFAALLGDTSSALAAIESGDELGLFDVVWCDHCPVLAPLRSEPRFIAARDKIAARAAEILAALT
jgi:serine/threonine-protein kinase